jgi:L-seryl-tRNA(Ser) seleniumtransferase
MDRGTVIGVAGITVSGNISITVSTNVEGVRVDVGTMLAQLPQVDAVLQLDPAADAIELHGRRAVTDAVRRELDTARERIREGVGVAPTAEQVLTGAMAHLDGVRADELTRVINATGVVLHTNLGRAPLSLAARQAVHDAAGYTSLEFDLATGGRGSRTAHLGEVAAELCGTESATVVNNGAAALMLVLAALATGREVVVSRGELVEIGGSYRLPDMMAVSGALLVEVGTTNRTRLADYRSVTGDTTGLLLKVHRSNYEIVGFTEDTSIGALAALGREEGIPVVHDLGSGLLRDQHAGPLAREPSVEASVRAGADLVIISGDKLLGGPQAGIIAGRADLVMRCTRHPLARAVRVDKLQRAALEATFASHRRADVPLDVPVMAMLHVDPATLVARAAWMAEQLGSGASVVSLTGVVGGGALPGVTLPSAGIALDDADADGLMARLRAGDPPVIARVEDGRVLVDLRTVPPSQDAELVDLLLAARD